MAKDRIKDLKNNSSWANVSYTKLSRKPINPDDDETNDEPTMINIENEYFINQFLKEVDSVQSNIENIDKFTQRVRQIQVQMLEPISNPKLGNELEELKENIKTQAYEISSKLKKMEIIPNNLHFNEVTNAHRRIQESQIHVLRTRFRDVMISYNQEIILHRERCKKTILRELEMSGCRKTDDELEDILENGSPGAYSFSILVDVEKTKQCLNEIEARHRDIIKLENSVKELHNMFQDLAIFVADQGNMIDCIEYNVSKATDFVEDAKNMVDKAGKYEKQANRKKILVLIIISLICIVIVVAFFLFFILQKKIRRM